MEWHNGTRLTAEERKALREEARATFDGKEVRGARFGYELAAFRLAVARDTGDILHLPVAGGAFEQPTRAVEIMAALQEEYRKGIAKKEGKR